VTPIFEDLSSYTILLERIINMKGKLSLFA